MIKIASILHDFLTENNFKLYEDLGNGNGVYVDETVMIRIINIYDHTYGNYCIEFDLWDTFDRWANCLDGFSSSNPSEVVMKTVETYKYIIAHKDEIITNGGYYENYRW